jgi:hypothetical protein
MTWGSHRTFCTFVDLVGNEIDFVRFDYEERFIRPQCTPGLPPNHVTRAHSTSNAWPHPFNDSHHDIYRRRNIFLRYIKRLRTLLSTCPTNRPVFQDQMETLLLSWKPHPPSRYLRLARLRPAASDKVVGQLKCKAAVSACASLLVTFQSPASSCGQVTRLICTGRPGSTEVQSSNQGGSRCIREGYGRDQPPPDVRGNVTFERK